MKFGEYDYLMILKKFLVNMTLILNLISHTGWMDSIDLHISKHK